MNDDLAKRVEADIAEIMERTGFGTPLPVPSFSYDETIMAVIRRFSEASAQAMAMVAESIEWMVDVLTPLVELLNGIGPVDTTMSRSMRRDLRALGLLDPPPQYNYRQTKRGRVRRLTPAMREYKRSVRQRRQGR